MKGFRRGRRIGLIGFGTAVALALSAGAAFAVFPSDSVTHFTGCLNTSASPGGTFVNVAQGENPSKACGKGQILAHLSGGDITNVQTASGSGLAGGTDNGAASLSLDSTGCSSGGVLKWNGTSWACGSDNNTSYGAGTGLDLSGTTFSVDSGYQLPQNCAIGQVPKSDGSNSWGCADDDNADLPHAFLAAPPPGFVFGGPESNEVAHLDVPAGDYTVVAKIHLKDGDRDASVQCMIPGLDQSGVSFAQSDSDFTDNSQGGNLTLTGVATFAQSGSISFKCQTFDSGVLFDNLKILATQVSS